MRGDQKSHSGFGEEESYELSMKTLQGWLLLTCKDLEVQCALSMLEVSSGFNLPGSVSSGC